jgi:hypothetical protein
VDTLRPIARLNRGSGAAAPFLWIETPQGNVEVWALGSDRFSVRAPDHEQLVVGLEEAQQAAHALAEWLGQSRVNMTIDDSQLDPEHGHAAPLLMAVGRLVLAGAALENVLLVDIAMRDIDRAGTVRDELGRELSELEGRPAGKLLERLRNLGIPDELDGSKAAHLTTRPRLNDDVR